MSFETIGFEFIDRVRAHRAADIGPDPGRFAAVIALCVLFCFTAAASAGEVRLIWDAVSDARVAIYEVQVSQPSGVPLRSVVGATTEARINNLTVGETYWFAVRACAPGRKLCSAFSNEISVTIAGADTAPAPRAAFAANRVRGPVPLTVVFTDESHGAVASRVWSLGDGATSTGTHVVHSYATPGRYSVTLEVTGPGGLDRVVKADLITALPRGSANKPAADAPPPAAAAGDVPFERPNAALPIETGTVTTDHQWQWVPFERSFSDPVVVAGPLSDNGGQPAVIAIDGISPTGFWLRIKEWDYLDDLHLPESLGYLAMERGVHQLADGTQVEAGRFAAAATDAWTQIGFAGEFTTEPVVVAAVMSAGDDQTVIARLQGIDIQGFDVRLYEQEANRPGARVETVSFIAWEPSVGEVNGLGFAVVRTAETLSDLPRPLQFEPAFGRPPVFIADIQTTNGGDPANLRGHDLSETGLIIEISEEQSLDEETSHTDEAVGYFVFGDRD
jgi:PKD repeat protein